MLQLSANMAGILQLSCWCGWAAAQEVAAGQLLAWGHYSPTGVHTDAARFART